MRGDRSFYCARFFVRPYLREFLSGIFVCLEKEQDNIEKAWSLILDHNSDCTKCVLICIMIFVCTVFFFLPLTQSSK